MGTEVQNIVANIDAFNKPLYYKNEILPELLKLQLQISAIAYGEDEESLKGENPKIYEVVDYLEFENRLFENAADRQLKHFKEGSTKLCNRIKNEISGRRGEKKLFEKIESKAYSNRVLKNVELNEEMGTTELDAVVILKNGILIIEAKNTAKNVYVDSKGDLFTYGSYDKKKGNIEEKMIRKQKILSKVLEKAGIHNVTIQSCVVLTNEKVELKAQNTRVKVCLLGMFNDYVEQLEKSNPILSNDQMKSIYKAIEMAKCECQYPFNDFDVQKYKKDFAELMVILNEKQRELDIALEQPISQQSQFENSVQKSQNWKQVQQPTRQQTQSKSQTDLEFERIFGKPKQQTEQQSIIQQSRYRDSVQQSQYCSQMKQPIPQQPEFWSGLQPQSRADKCFDLIQSATELGKEAIPTILKCAGVAAMITVGLSHPVMSSLLKKRLLF